MLSQPEVSISLSTNTDLIRTASSTAHQTLLKKTMSTSRRNVAVTSRNDSSGNELIISSANLSISLRDIDGRQFASRRKYASFHSVDLLVTSSLVDKPAPLALAVQSQ